MSGRFYGPLSKVGGSASTGIKANAVRGFRGQRLVGPWLLLPLLLPATARADIVALPGFGTEVSALGGTRVISKGVVKGQNQFHRLTEFDTRTPGISVVQFNNSDINNAPIRHVIVGVTGSSFIDKSVALANRGNLYLLSPNGINIFPGASFRNVDTLMLTTSSKLALGANVFDVYASDAATLVTGDYSASPSSTLSGLLKDNLQEGEALGGVNFFLNGPGAGQLKPESFAQSFGIEIAPGSNLTVDRSLLLVTHKAPISIKSASLNARGGAAGDGLAIVTQNLDVGGTASQRSVFQSNTEILIREPIVSSFPARGGLASRLYGDVFDGVKYSGTASRLRITGLDFVSGDKVAAGSTWNVLLQSSGLVCDGLNCGIGRPSVTILENDGKESILTTGVKVNPLLGDVTTSLPLVGRVSVLGDFKLDASNPNFQDAADKRANKVGQAIYAGIDLKDSRVISGYAYGRSAQPDFQELPLSPRLGFKFDPGFQQGGGRLENLQFIISDATNVAYVDLGGYDGKSDLPVSGRIAGAFFNNNIYPGKGSDLGMYWFYSGDAGANNSISFGSIPSSPMGGSGNPGSVTIGNGATAGASSVGGAAGNGQSPELGLNSFQNTYIFDNTLFVIDQNVSEDYEPSSPSSKAGSELLTVNLSPAESETDGCSSGSDKSGCESSSPR